MYKFKHYFCRNWPLFVFLRRNHTRANTQCTQNLFWIQPEPWCVTIHNLRTVAPCYGELLALLVYLTWLLLEGLLTSVVGVKGVP